MATPPIDDAVEDMYGELRRLAEHYVRRERAKSLQATELVHEAYLRLAKDAPGRFESRAHFVAIAAIAMRRLLVERARSRAATKRGGHAREQVTLNDAMLGGVDPGQSIDLIGLDRALTRLSAIDAAHARVVELRFFGGLSIDETAEALGISPATVKRHWTMAKAWLLRELDGAS